MRNTTHMVTCLLIAMVFTCECLQAQVINRGGRLSRTPQQRAPAQDPAVDLRATPLLQLDPATLLNDQLPEGFRGLKRNVDIFQGFPNYPPNWPVPPGWPALGGYPSPYPAAGEKPNMVLALPRSLPARPDDWPSWFDSRSRGRETAFQFDMALLVRSSDRVWYKAADEIAFVPLAFYDKGRVIRAGGEVDVRHRGGYELHFHGGGYLRVGGHSKLRVETLSETINVVKISDYNWAWLVTRLQPLRTILPDGSVLEMEGNSLVHLSRGNGIGVLLHTGEGNVRLSSSVGSVTIPHAHRVKFFISAGVPAPISIELQLDSGLGARRDARVLQVDGGEHGGVVIWGGLRVTLQPGQELRVDPLAGAEFPEYTQDRNERN